MKKLIYLLCSTLLFVATGKTQNITAAEYFFDTDPGPGSGTALTITTPGTNVPFTANISTISLAAGFHFVAIRTKDENGKWGLLEKRGFYINPVPVDMPSITAAEYFFDTDPGVGNAIPISIPAPGILYTDSLILPLGALPLGNHRITVRVKDANGKWGLLENKPFNVCTRYGPQSKMSYQVEYNKVFFTNYSTDADSTEWQFGDNTSDTVFTPIKTYGVAGNYTVKLISKNLCKKDTLIKPVAINGIQRINAPRAGNIGVATVVFDGNGFTAGTVVKLKRNNTILLPDDKLFISSNRIIGYFNLTAVDTGSYHIIADLGGGPLDTLKNSMYISIGREALVSFSIGGRNPQRFGRMSQTATLQNLGNEDAIMVPFAMALGYKPGLSSPQLALQDPVLDLTNVGIFQNTFQYLSSNSISGDVMNVIDVDVNRKRQLMAFYQLKIPAETKADRYIRIYNTDGLLTYTSGALVHPPLYKSGIVGNDTLSPFRDCMNSFLKKAVKKNITVTINDIVWNDCFNTAFDTLTRTIRNLSRNLSLQNELVPMKAVYSTLLAQMSQCGSSGMPASINSAAFQNIIKDVTYNWLFLENLDSIGRPCFDTTETSTFRSSQNTNKVDPITEISNKIEDDPCPGASIFPELAEQCKPFMDACGSFGKLGDIDNALLVVIGKKIFEKLTEPFDKFCKVNSASVSCQKFCEQTSIDPNVKSGPGDNLSGKHINHLNNTRYSIYFENLASATAPAAYVEVRDTLDKTKFDISSFQTGNFGWGDSVAKVDANRSDYSVLKDLRPVHPNKLRIDVRMDTASGVVNWKFYTVDTTTLQLTDDPAEGFLPPNTDGVRGVGYVTFTIKPKAGVTTGTVINNKATIVFDNNAPIITDVWQHIIDTTRPQSQMTALPANSPTANFVVNWSGSDAHSGIDRIAVFVSINDSIFKQWKPFTTAVSDTFHGQFNKTYKFYSVAFDQAGNFEDAPADPYSTPDAMTMPVIPLPLRWLSFTASKLQTPDRSLLTWKTDNEVNTSYLDVERSIDGNIFIKIGTVGAANTGGQHTYSFTDMLPASGVNYYRLKQADMDGRFTYSPVKILNFGTVNNLLIYPTIVSSTFIIDGLKAGTVLKIIDASGRIVKRIDVTQSQLIADISNLAVGVYMVQVVDEKGNGQTKKIIKQ